MTGVPGFARLDGLRNCRGGVSVICMMLISLAVLVTLAAASSSVNEVLRAKKMVRAQSALSIAEAGIDYSVVELSDSTSYTGTSGAVSFGDGTFTATVTLQSDGSYLVSSVGALPTGESKTVQVVVSRSGTGYLSPASILSAGGAKLTGNSTLKTSPSNQHTAGIRANGNITVSGNATIDGGLYAGGSVSVSGNASYTSKTSGATKMLFPTEAEISAMDSAWLAAAKAGTTISGFTMSGNNSATYSTPLYINGNVKMSGNNTLTFTGTGVVYIDGTLTMTGNQNLNNGGILVVKGAITQTGNSVYKATGDLGTCGLVSLSTDSTQAIQCTGNGDTTPMGLVYAPHGGIKLTGNTYLYGGLVAGSTDSAAITMTGNASIAYPTALAGNTLLPRSLAVSSWLEL